MCSERERESDSRGSVSSVASRRLPCRVTVMWYGRVKTFFFFWGGGGSPYVSSKQARQRALWLRGTERIAVDC